MSTHNIGFYGKIRDISLVLSGKKVPYQELWSSLRDRGAVERSCHEVLR